MNIDFKKAVLDYKDLVYKIACIGCGNTYDADDIIQEVFMSLYCGKKQFESEEHLKAWLIKSTVNRVKSYHRSFHIKKRMDISEAYISADNPEEEAELRQIREAVLALPYDYRICVILYYYFGYSGSEIAELLKTKEPTVRTRLRRAREKLKIQLKEAV